MGPAHNLNGCRQEPDWQHRQAKRHQPSWFPAGAAVDRRDPHEARRGMPAGQASTRSCPDRLGREQREKLRGPSELPKAPGTAMPRHISQRADHDHTEERGHQGKQEKGAERPAILLCSGTQDASHPQKHQGAPAGDRQPFEATMQNGRPQPMVREWKRTPFGIKKPVAYGEVEGG